MAIQVSHGGRFDEYVYRMIIEAALEGWTPELYINKSARTNTLTNKEAQNIHFLARCCLVNQEWRRLSQRLLYRGVVHDETSSRLRRVLRKPHIAALVHYIATKSDVRCSAVDLSYLEEMPALHCLVVEDLIVGDAIDRPLRNQISPFLSHLLYEGGDTHQLGELLGTLPNLHSLHVGRFSFSSRQIERRQIGSITCKLRQITLQSVYHYDKRLFDWILASSKDSIEHLVIANYGSLLNDIIPYLNQAKKLELTVKKNVFNVPEDPDQYQLSAIIPRFPRLEELHLHVGFDWTSDWPDDKHALLQEERPHIRFHYQKGRSSFLECIAPVNDTKN